MTWHGPRLGLGSTAGVVDRGCRRGHRADAGTTGDAYWQSAARGFNDLPGSARPTCRRAPDSTLALRVSHRGYFAEVVQATMSKDYTEAAATERSTSFSIRMSSARATSHSRR